MFNTGRMFEGSAAIMLKSLENILQLPEEALIWPGNNI